MMITQQELKQVIRYNPERGSFTWLVNHTRVKSGDRAGFINNDGYRYIVINYRTYSAQRLAYLYMTGVFPHFKIMHINGDRADNRWNNLQLTKYKKRINNASVRTGVSWYKQTKQWRAYIKIKRKQIFLGYYGDREDAIVAREKAERLYWGK